MYISLNKILILLLLVVTLLFAGESEKETIIFHPISHATFVIESKGITIYVDPIGDSALYARFSKPDIILITHDHGDHLSPETINAIKTEKTTVIGPQSVINQLGYGIIMNNGDSKHLNAISIEAIPMYNLTEERLKFHPKGNGNGYVLTVNGKRIYISGDTEDIPEMRKLKNIDYAFIGMNLPYTMSVEQAASAVLEMKPKVVLPYHYRGTEGMSDLEQFKKLVSKQPDIEVRILDWYK